MTNNYYTIKILVTNSLIDIRVNDISIHNDNVVGSVSAVLPINHAILNSGVQSYCFVILPLQGSDHFLSDSNFSASIWLYDCNGDVISPRIELQTKEINLSEHTQLPIVNFNGCFEAQVNYTINRWSNCIELDSIQSLREAVVLKYREIEKILQTQNDDTFIKIFQQRDSEIAKAFYMDPSNVSIRSKEIMSFIYEGYKVRPITGAELMPLWADKRVVTLLKSDFSPALTLANEETGELIEIEMLLGIMNGQSNFIVV